MNPYTVLGISPSASIEEAKQAYRRLAMLHHPDRGGSEAKFKIVKAAWEAIEAGWKPVPQASTQKSSQQRKSQEWAKPVDAWPGYYQEGMFKAAPKPRPPASQPEKIKIVQADRPIGQQKYLGDFIARVSLAEAYHGFIVEIAVDGARLRVQVPPGVPHGLKHAVTTEGGEVKITILINQNLYSFAHYDIAKSAVVMINGAPLLVKRTGELKLRHELHVSHIQRGTNLELLDFLGAKYIVKIPPYYDTKNPIRVEGRGYVDWCSTKSAASDARGDVLITLQPTEIVPFSHL